MKSIADRLIKIADELDDKGEHEAADQVDKASYVEQMALKGVPPEAIRIALEDQIDISYLLRGGVTPQNLGSVLREMKEKSEYYKQQQGADYLGQEKAEKWTTKYLEIARPGTLLVAAYGMIWVPTPKRAYPTAWNEEQIINEIIEYRYQGMSAEEIYKQKAEDRRTGLLDFV